MNMKLKKLMFIVVGFLFLTACGGNASEVENDTKNQLDQESQTTENSTSTESSQSLSSEYQALANDILAAVEKGYHYQGEGMWGGLDSITRQGQYVMSGDPDAEGFMVTYNIGLMGEKNYHVNMVEGEVSEIYDNEMPDAGLDLAGKYLQYLMGMLEAHSSGSLYEDSASAQWEVLDVTMNQEGGSTEVTVKTQLPNSKQDPTVETFIIVDGLLEGLSISTPYMNSGQASETTYTYLSRGPVDGNALRALYEKTEADAQ